MSGPAWEQFWKKVFRYMQDHSLPSFDLLFYILSVPSIVHLENRELIRELERVMRQVGFSKKEAVIETHLLEAILIVGEAMNRYAKKKKFPRTFHTSLSMLYNLIMQDFTKEEKGFSFDEALSRDENLSEMKIQPRTWFVINAVLNNENAEQVRRIICRETRL